MSSIFWRRERGRGKGGEGGVGCPILNKGGWNNCRPNTPREWRFFQLLKSKDDNELLSEDARRRV